jgi:hypothetical protein
VSTAGTTLDTGALIALEAGSPYMRALLATTARTGAQVAVPAGVLAQACARRSIPLVTFSPRSRRRW